MINFENQVCDACGKPFDKDSDIVVCPECGTPHHRECWKQTGHCVNEARHNEGFEWKGKVIAAVDGVKCTECGKVNPKGTLFCENCGRALTGSNEANHQSFNVPGGTVHVQRFDNLGQEGFNNYVNRRFTGEIDGISTKDIAAYIGMNAQYYTYKFKRMDTNPNYKPFNGAAFAVAPLWFLFRKMWQMAIVAAIFNFTTSLPSLIMMLVEAGKLSSVYMFTGIETAAKVMLVINTIVNLIFGFIAIPMYRKNTIKQLNELKLKANGDNRMYYSMLMEQSGPSKFGMIVVVFFIAYMFFSL